MSSEPTAWLTQAVAAFGVACRDKLAGPGDREAAIRSPLETLLGAAGSQIGVPAVFHDEVRDESRRVRPDYGVSVAGAITGYVEVKAPGRSIDPGAFTGHDREQWQRQRDLPNLLYTNGTQWRLYRDGEPVGVPVSLLGGALETAGSDLSAEADFEALLTEFLRWNPAPITSVAALVRAVAPLTRLLRGEVLDQLAAEERSGGAVGLQPFRGLARDWRALLFPTADDATFADGYAQTVTFALLLARTEGITVQGAGLHEVGAALGPEHSLMGKALQLLTDDVAADFKVTLDLLVRVVGAVDWTRVRAGRRDTYLHLYEHFLELYDPELRKQSGSYYTPREVVEEMVRLTEEALVTCLGRARGFADPDVLTIDPAMGTGTYLHTIIERVAARAAASDGPGAVAGAIGAVAERLIGFELQTGPYAVAELRTTDLVRESGAQLPSRGMRLFVTDTLDDPHAEQTQLGSGLELLAASRRRANEVKAKANVTVVIGNPPYRERAEGRGGWVEEGDPASGTAAPLDAFRAPGNGQAEYVLKNLYVYFWRWGTWKVFDASRSDVDGDAGVVCFISTAGYLRGPGFKGMREYLRRTCSEGWIIDLSPEGQTPDVATRVFPGVRQPLAIGLFVRRADADADLPAVIHYRAVHGRRQEKYDALAAAALDGDGWREARTEWHAPLTPAAEGGWDEHPALGDLMPWVAPGVKANRTWVYAPSRGILGARWRALMDAPSPTARGVLLKETRDSAMAQRKAPLPGTETHRAAVALADEAGGAPTAIRVGYRSFDRQWLLPDARLIDQARPPLWAARVPGQVFVVEQHSKPITDGPGLVLSALIPDMDHFNNRGGRTLPLLHPDGTPNTAPGLLMALSEALGTDVTAEDVLAYVAAVVAHPGFTRTFADELTTPGIRVPVTADPDVWRDAVALGREVVWAHTYGERFADADAGRPEGSIRYLADDPRRPLALTAVTAMPQTLDYDADRRALRLGTGQWGPVQPPVWAYAVGGKQVIKSWFNYRKASPGGKKTSPLDDIHLDAWPAEWTTDLVDLLTVLTRLVALEPTQGALLERAMAGPLVSMENLGTRGVRWPGVPADRSPRYGSSIRAIDQDGLL